LVLIAFGEEAFFFEREDFLDFGDGILVVATCSSSESSFITFLLFFAGSDGLLFSNS
jgi:hypothetical protein